MQKYAKYITVIVLGGIILFSAIQPFWDIYAQRKLDEIVEQQLTLLMHLNLQESKVALSNNPTSPETENKIAVLDAVTLSLLEENLLQSVDKQKLYQLGSEELVLLEEVIESFAPYSYEVVKHLAPDTGFSTLTATIIYGGITYTLEMSEEETIIILPQGKKHLVLTLTHHPETFRKLEESFKKLSTPLQEIAED